MSIQVRNDGRLAGRVIRYHTWPHIRPQTVAEHSWQLLRILLVIWPEAPSTVLSYIVRHDCGELTTGDMPFPVKRDNPVLAHEASRIEDEGLALQVRTGFLPDIPDATPSQRWAVKLAEFVEMWEWALEELLMGNQFARLVEQRCREAVWERIRSDVRKMMVGEQLEIAHRAKEYVERRSREWPTE